MTRRTAATPPEGPYSSRAATLLRVRLWLGLAGIVCAGMAVFLAQRPLAWIAIVMLAASVVLRLVARRRADDRNPREADGPE